jgi:hypothetical protein
MLKGDLQDLEARYINPPPPQLCLNSWNCEILHPPPQQSSPAANPRICVLSSPLLGRLRLVSSFRLS